MEALLDTVPARNQSEQEARCGRVEYCLRSDCYSKPVLKQSDNFKCSQGVAPRIKKVCLVGNIRTAQNVRPHLENGDQRCFFKFSRCHGASPSANGASAPVTSACWIQRGNVPSAPRPS